MAGSRKPPNKRARGVFFLAASSVCNACFDDATSAANEASQLFCDDLLQYVPVQTQVRDQSLQLRILLA
jgi:hypothetical protein